MRETQSDLSDLKFSKPNVRNGKLSREMKLPFAPTH